MRLAVRKGHDEVLFARRKHEVVVRGVVPRHVLKLINVELAPLLDLQVEALDARHRKHALGIRHARQVFLALHLFALLLGDRRRVIAPVVAALGFLVIVV